jgi:hypothetical protein
MYKKISFRSASKPGPGNRAGFFIAWTRGTPKTPWVFWGPNAGGPKHKRFLAAAFPHPKPQNQQRSEENASISERPKRKSGRPAAGLAQPRDEHGAEPARFVEALNTPVVAPVMCLFGGLRDSLFINPFKKVTKAPCKFHLLQGACSSPVVCSTPLFLPCSLQGYRAATAAAVKTRLCPGRNAAWPQRAVAS